MQRNELVDMKWNEEIPAASIDYKILSYKHPFIWLFDH